MIIFLNCLPTIQKLIMMTSSEKIPTVLFKAVRTRSAQMNVLYLRFVISVQSSTKESSVCKITTAAQPSNSYTSPTLPSDETFTSTPYTAHIHYLPVNTLKTQMWIVLKLYYIIYQIKFVQHYNHIVVQYSLLIFSFVTCHPTPIKGE